MLRNNATTQNVSKSYKERLKERRIRDDRRFMERCFLGFLVVVSLVLYGCLSSYSDTTVTTGVPAVVHAGPSKHVEKQVQQVAAKKIPKPQPFEYELEVVATAYWTHDPVDASGHGIAFDGTPAVAYKTIAVDPKVIPLQSMVYVQGFGWMRANDTGNAIKGAIIDIAMPSREEAWKWGRRKVLVKVRPPMKGEAL